MTLIPRTMASSNWRGNPLSLPSGIILLKNESHFQSQFSLTLAAPCSYPHNQCPPDNILFITPVTPPTSPDLPCIGSAGSPSPEVRTTLNLRFPQAPIRPGRGPPSLEFAQEGLARICVLAQPHTSCRILEKSQTSAEPQFPHIKVQSGNSW